MDDGMTLRISFSINKTLKSSMCGTNLVYTLL